MKKLFSILLSALLLLSFAFAEGSTVIVAVGDSYISGEGIEPFYGQDADMAERCRDYDWLAHRSEKSWPGMLALPAVDGFMKDHHGENFFFSAASGAKATQLFLLTDEEKAAGKTAEQKKEYNRDGVKGTAMLPPQLDVFDELDEKGLKADYVLISVGGNDIDFKLMVAESMTGLTNYLSGDTPEEKGKTLFESMYEGTAIRSNIKRAYTDIAARAGAQATIIVTGYPSVLAPDPIGTEGLFPGDSTKIMNAAGLLFNEEIRKLVEECRGEGLDIYYVSVQEAFEGHGAYSEDPYIHPIITGALDYDLKSSMMVSSYSMHPNEKGAETYARCVQEFIDRLESEKTN